MRKSDQPIVLGFRVESTNFATAQQALEQLAKRSQVGQRPFSVGEVVEGEFWLATVTEKRDLLNEEAKPEPEPPELLMLPIFSNQFEPMELRKAFSKCLSAMALMRSMIKCGEDFTPTSTEAVESAFAAAGACGL